MPIGGEEIDFGENISAITDIFWGGYGSSHAGSFTTSLSGPYVDVYNMALPPGATFTSPEIVAYSWITITNPTGIIQSSSQSHVCTQVNLGFNFDFYGTSYNQIYLDSSGFLCFATVPYNYGSQPIPGTSLPNGGIIAPFWRPFDLSKGGRILYLSTPDQFVVTWEKISGLVSSCGPQTFQVILKPDGKIIFQYKNITNDVSTTAGVEDQEGENGLGYYEFPSGMTAVLFSSPPDDPVYPQDPNYVIKSATSFTYSDVPNSDFTYDFAWEEPMLPTPAGLIDDDQSVEIPLDFNFPFYGQGYDSIYICSNGFISFTQEVDYGPDPMPSLNYPNNIIAPFWRDLNPSSGGRIVYKKYGDHIVITWEGVPDSSDGDKQTFQAILYQSGDIIFQYKDITGSSTVTSVGIENQYGTIGKTCLGMPMNNSAVRLSPSPSDLSQYKTITYEYNWVNTTTPTGIIIDDQSELFDLPFTLDFYGKQYDYIYICSNGFLSFSASIDCTPDSIPNTAAPNEIIAPLWQDLNPGEGGSITYLSEADRFVVTWDHVPDYYSDVPQTFQVIIHKTGRIYFQYQDISFDSQTSIGIENSLGSAGKNIIESYVAIKFRPSGYDPTPCAYCRQNTTQASGITVDDQSKQFTLPFTLNFYGQNYNSIYVCSNGFLSLASSTDWSPDLIPGTNSPNGIMAPFWRDLDPSADGVITYLSDPNKFVVSWDRVPTYSSYGLGTPQSFQVIIHHSGEIIFQYKEVNSRDGIITSIGVENQTGTQGHSYIFPNFPLIQFHPRHYTSLVWGFPDTSLRADEVNASYHVNVIHDYIHRTLDMADDDPNFIQVKVKVSTPNEPGYRPAIKTINLPAYNLDPFPYPGAARESDVVYHEYTHFFEHSIYGQDFINFIADEYTSQEAVAMTEGYADYMACALNNDPNINFPQGGVSRDISVFRRYPQDYIPPWEDLNRIAVHQNGLILANTLWDIRQAFDDPAITDADKVDADFLAVHSLLIEPLQFIDIREWFFCLDGFFYSGNHYQMIEDILNLHGINEEGYTLQEIVYSWIYGNQPSNILLDDHIEMVNLLFTFNFYGQEYTTVCVSDNGFICFDPDENDPSSPNPVPLPNIEKPNAVIAPFWTDFDPTPFIPGLSRIEYLNDADKFVVAWRNVKDKIHAFDDPENNYSFQVILHNNGDIVFQYNSTFPNNTNTTFPHTIGIENESGLKCIPHLEYISGPFALKFFHK